MKYVLSDSYTSLRNVDEVNSTTSLHKTTVIDKVSKVKRLIFFTQFQQKNKLFINYKITKKCQR